MRAPASPTELRLLEERGPWPKRWGAATWTSAGVGQESAGPGAPVIISEGHLGRTAPGGSRGWGREGSWGTQALPRAAGEDLAGRRTARLRADGQSSRQGPLQPCGPRAGRSPAVALRKAGQEVVIPISAPRHTCVWEGLCGVGVRGLLLEPPSRPRSRQLIKSNCPIDRLEPREPHSD